MSSPLRQRLPCLLAILLVPVIVYFNSLRNPFHFDDMHTVVNNPHIRELRNIPKLFAYPQMFSAKSHPRGMYRPMLLTTYALNYRLAGMSNVAFHAVNLAIHLVNALLVFFIFIELMRIASHRSETNGPSPPGELRDRSANVFAGLAALLFALHPIQTECLNYISCRSETLASLFYLLALLAFIKAHRVADSTPARSIALVSASLLFYVLSLLTKTIAISFPVMILFFSLVLYVGKEWRRRAGRLLLYQIPFWSLTLVYLLFRNTLFGYSFAPTKPRGIVTNLLTQVYVMIHYLKLIIFPFGLSVDRDFPIIRTPFDYRFIVSFLIIIAIFALIIRLVLKNRGVLGFCLAWFFIALLPTSSVLPLEVVINEHRLYLSVAGLSLAVSLLLRDLAVRQRLSRNAGKIIIAALAIVFLLYAGLVYARNKIWSTEVGLWSDALRKSPTCVRAFGKLGNAYRNQNNFPRALETYLTGMKQGNPADPQMPWLIYNIGTLYHDRKDYQHAAEYYGKALEVGGPSVAGYVALASACLDMGKHELAIESLRRAQSMMQEPSFSLHNQLGLAYLRLGRKSEAIAEWRKSLSLNPNQPEIVEYLQKEEKLQRSAEH